MQHTYCRLCEGSCGLLAETDSAGQLTALSGDRTDPVSGGFLCDTARASVRALQHPQRITQPMQRRDGKLVPSDWQTAIREIGSRLREIRGQTGASSVAMYLGDEVDRSSRDLLRALAFGVGMGTPGIFSELCLGEGPRIRATELAIGHPSHLLSDLSRAHFVLLLGADQREAGWGPGQAGAAFEAAINHSRKTKSTRVVTADPRKTALAESMDQHLSIRPGSEPFLMLGVLSAIINGGWSDKQFVRDYTRNGKLLEAVAAEWPVDRCAAICGVEKSALSGVALKFSRAAMGVIHPTASSFRNANAAAGAWAWVTAHAVTANLLRPGGLYDHQALIDLQPLLESIPTDGAPRTRVAGAPLMLLQAPATLLADEILTPGDGQVRALLNVAGAPLDRLPARKRTKQALGALDLLVHMGRVMDDTAAMADWVLPLAHPWERADVTLHNTARLPVTGALYTPAVSAAPPEARTAGEILRALFSVARPGLRGSVWGRHLGFLAQLTARVDAESWEQRLLDWAGDVEWDAFQQPPHRAVSGASDRATWRLSTPDSRIDLFPEAIRAAVGRLEPLEVDPKMPLFLRTSRKLDRAPDAHHRESAEPLAWVHPDSGVADGQEVTVETRHGAVRVVARHDARLRRDTVDLPASRVPAALDLLSPDRIDPITGAPEQDGLHCRLG